MGKRHHQIFGLTLITLIHHSMVYLRMYALWEIYHVRIIIHIDDWIQNLMKLLQVFIVFIIF